ncbi:MAG: hypothetical protein RM021_031795, partial [Nostoc sp. EkiNYC01]|nr:hypothetical protein [Nostoc sp. EkiNYC01]
MTQIKDRAELLTLKDNDLLVISDSASNVIKKLKWSTVKNYFQSGGSLAPWKYINSNYLASVA